MARAATSSRQTHGAIHQRLRAPLERLPDDRHLAQVPAEVRNVVVAPEPNRGNVARTPEQKTHRGAVATIVVDQIPATGGLRRAVDLVELVDDSVRIAIDRINRALRGNYPRYPGFEPDTGVPLNAHAKSASRTARPRETRPT
jgi:hypothetical protein